MSYERKNKVYFKKSIILDPILVQKGYLEIRNENIGLKRELSDMKKLHQASAKKAVHDKKVIEKQEQIINDNQAHIDDLEDLFEAFRGELDEEKISDVKKQTLIRVCSRFKKDKTSNFLNILAVYKGKNKKINLNVDRNQCDYQRN